MKIDPHTLANICRVAASRFQDNAALLRQLIDTEPTGEFDITPRGEAARQLAEQFEKQAHEACELSLAFAEAEHLIEVLSYESTKRYANHGHRRDHSW